MASAQALQDKQFGNRQKLYLTSADGEVTGLDAYCVIPMEASTRLTSITDTTIDTANSTTRLLAVTSLLYPHYGQITALEVNTGTVCVMLNTSTQ